MSLLSRATVLAGVLIASIISFSFADAQPANNLETYKEALKHQEAGLLIQYGKALDSLLNSFKQKGDIEKYLVLEAEKKRFDEENTVRPPSEAEEAFRAAVKVYNKASVDLLKKYILALDGLIKNLMMADRIEEAKEAKVEKERAVSQYETAETMLHKTKPVNESKNVSGDPNVFTNPETDAEDQTHEDATVEPATPSVKEGGPISVNLGGDVKLEMVWIRPGGFMMGSPNSEKGRDKGEGPVHRVMFRKGFWMGKYEVTQEQWEQVMGNNPNNFKRPQNPVELVSWSDCQDFVAKLNQRAEVKRQARNAKFRLPTEAEWEYACRAGTSTRFYSGDSESDLNRVAWYLENSGKDAHHVGQKPPNRFGLFDMLGNVQEWCQDRLGDYPEGLVTDPTGAPEGSSYICRGGNFASEDFITRSATRNYGPSGARFPGLGLRLVLSPE